MISNKEPRISVIMSVYNGEKYLTEALESICSQTLEDWELIAVDDCSTDRTPEILREYADYDGRIRVIRNEKNKRLAASLNIALENARAKYVARIDADDICLPERLEKQLAFMEARPQTALSSCRYMTKKDGVISSGGGGGLCDSSFVKAMLLFSNPILHPGVIARSDIMKKYRYNESLTCSEDLDLWTRLAADGNPIEIQSEYLMIYRIHGTQITSTTLAKQREEVMGIEKRYYSSILEPMPKDKEDYFIDGMYFRNREALSAAKFSRFIRWIKKTVKKTGALEADTINRAAIEILAEYKRHGAPPTMIVKGIIGSGISLLFAACELSDRKKRAKIDGALCIRAAEAVGLRHANNSSVFPTFS